MAFPFHVNMLSGIQPENQWRKLHWKLRKQRKTGKNQVLPEKMMSGHCAGNLVDGAPAARFVSRLKQGIEGNLYN